LIGERANKDKLLPATSLKIPCLPLCYGLLQLAVQ